MTVCMNDFISLFCLFRLDVVGGGGGGLMRVF